MIELAILLVLFRRFGDVAARKGRSRSWGWLPAGGWIAGELVGLAVAIAAGASQGATYLAGIGAAVVGAIVGGVMVARLEERRPVDVEVFD